MENQMERESWKQCNESTEETWLLKWLGKMAILRGGKVDQPELLLYRDKASAMLLEPSITGAWGPYKYTLSDFQMALEELEDTPREEGEKAMPTWATIRVVVDKHRCKRQNSTPRLPALAEPPKPMTHEEIFASDEFKKAAALLLKEMEM
jgi:hypothetical protein